MSRTPYCGKATFIKIWSLGHLVAQPRSRRWNSFYCQIVTSKYILVDIYSAAAIKIVKYILLFGFDTCIAAIFYHILHLPLGAGTANYFHPVPSKPHLVTTLKAGVG